MHQWSTCIGCRSNSGGSSSFRKFLWWRRCLTTWHRICLVCCMSRFMWRTKLFTRLAILKSTVCISCLMGRWRLKQKWWLSKRSNTQSLKLSGRSRSSGPLCSTCWSSWMQGTSSDLKSWSRLLIWSWRANQRRYWEWRGTWKWRLATTVDCCIWRVSSFTRLLARLNWRSWRTLLKSMICKWLSSGSYSHGCILTNRQSSSVIWQKLVIPKSCISGLNLLRTKAPIIRSY